MLKLFASLFIVVFLVVRPVSAAPGAATLLTPSGEVFGTTITFSWDSVPESTWYLFWLGQGTPTALVLQQWYTAEQAGCANGGTCAISMTPPVSAGGYVWFIQTWGAGMTGPWSAAKGFVVKDPAQNWGAKLPDARRLTLVFDDQAVLDHETGLVWERSPTTLTAGFLFRFCAQHNVGGRLGFREPTIAELGTLRGNGGLPTGHPFEFGFNEAKFWSQTEDPGNSSNAWYITVNPFAVAVGSKLIQARQWCVRAPSGQAQ